MKRITVFMIITLLLLSISIVSGQALRTYTSSRATMTAPGYSMAVYSGGFTRMIWYFTVASKNTAVSVAVQGKKGNSDWTNIWADSLRYTANGSYGLEWDNVSLTDSLRLRFVSEEGGTAATITHNVALSGGN